MALCGGAVMGAWRATTAGRWRRWNPHPVVLQSGGVTHVEMKAKLHPASCGCGGLGDLRHQPATVSCDVEQARRGRWGGRAGPASCDGAAKGAHEAAKGRARGG